MPTKPSLAFRVFAFVLAGLVILAAAFVLLFDFKGLFERRATAALGHPVTVADLHLGLFPLRLRFSDLHVGEPNADPMMQAGEVDATMGFWRLVEGHLTFHQLVVNQAKVRVDRTADGTNWDSRKPLGAQTELPEIEDLSLHDTQLLYSDAASRTNLTLALETREPKEGGERTLVVNGKGTYQGAPTIVTLSGGSILKLREEAPYPVDLKMTSGATEITAKGQVTDPVHIAGLDVALTVKGASAEDLYRIAGVALPPTPPYQIASHLDHQGEKWVFQNLTWKMGDSDLAGDLTWDLSAVAKKGKPRLRGKLHAETLNLNDLAGFIGAAPGDAKTPVEVKQAAADRERAIQAGIAAAQGAPPTPDDKKGDPKAPATKAEEMGSQLVIPDTTLDFKKINSMNAAVNLTAAHIINAGFPVDSLTADIALTDGVLKLKPLNFGVDNGHIAIDLTLNASDPYVQRTDAIVNVQNYPLQRLVGKAGDKLENTSFGAIGGRIELHGEGDSFHRILATSNGTFGLIAQGGQISDLMVSLIGLNIAKTVGLLLSGDKPVPVRCMATDFEITKGTMEAKALVVDTQPSIVTGDGTIDLATEVMKIKLHPKPKSAGVGSLRVPFHVSGTFADPSIGPDVAALTLRSGAAAVLGVLLTPLGSLLATIEGGGGKDADCGALLAQVSQDSGKDGGKKK